MARFGGYIIFYEFDSPSRTSSLPSKRIRISPLTAYQRTYSLAMSKLSLAFNQYLWKPFKSFSRWLWTENKTLYELQFRRSKCINPTEGFFTWSNSGESLKDISKSSLLSWSIANNYRERSFNRPWLEWKNYLQRFWEQGRAVWEN